MPLAGALAAPGYVETMTSSSPAPTVSVTFTARHPLMLYAILGPEGLRSSLRIDQSLL